MGGTDTWGRIAERLRGFTHIQASATNHGGIMLVSRMAHCHRCLDSLGQDIT